MLGAILGNYRITTQISGGGMGSVYRAQHALLERSAAVKLLRPELTANDELRQRFFNEAQAATKIRHPGIVEIYDFGYTEDGLAYLVMELLDGAPLSKRLVERGRFAEIDAAYVARGIASALKAAHAKGIVHRDLKPDNIFLVPDSDGPTGERIKILDFGIAKLADALPDHVRHTQTGALIGTPLYMAPEQARTARTIDHRADLYSLGCVLHEMLVGAPPFVAEGAGEIIAMHLFTRPVPPSKQVPVSPAIDAIVMRLLAKEPHERFDSAKELIEAIDAACGFGPQVSGPFAVVGESRPNAVAAVPNSSMNLRQLDTAPPQRTPEKRSNMALIAGLITLLIAAAVAAIIALRGGGGDDDRSTGAPPAPPGPGIEAHSRPPPAPPPSVPPGPPGPLKDFPRDNAAEPIEPTVRPPPPPPPTRPAPPPRKRPTPTPPNPDNVPVTRPDQIREPVRDSRDRRPVRVPGRGPTTPNGSPYEPALDDSPRPLDDRKPAGGN